jgi:hypothetical protein
MVEEYLCFVAPVSTGVVKSGGFLLSWRPPERFTAGEEVHVCSILTVVSEAGRPDSFSPDCFGDVLHGNCGFKWLERGLVPPCRSVPPVIVIRGKAGTLMHRFIGYSRCPDEDGPVLAVTVGFTDISDIHDIHPLRALNRSGDREE